MLYQQRLAVPRQSPTRIARPIAARLILAALGWLAVAVGQAAAQAPDPAQLLFDREARDEAIRDIPFKQMHQAMQDRLWEVIGKPSIYRRMPVQVVPCEQDMHVFLIRYPEVIVNMWQLMGITKVSIKRTGDYTFAASDGAGTDCNVELVYGTPNLHVYFAEGTYEGPLFKRRMTGRCVMVLKSDYKRQHGATYVTNRLDVFVRLDSVGVEVLVKTLHPLVGKSADYNFVESTKFIGQVHEAAERNGPGVQRLAGKLTNVDAAIRQTFVELSEASYERAVLRESLDATPSEEPARAEEDSGKPRPAQISPTALNLPLGGQ